MDWDEIKYFKPSEFNDPGIPGSWEYMDPETIQRLDILREKTGWPIITHNKFGLRGCVCVSPKGHSPNSLHYATNKEGCSAVDWHFGCDADPRVQAMQVMRSGFPRIGVYYDWHWDGELLQIGFHTDLGSRPQVWKRQKGKYFYLLK